MLPPPDGPAVVFQIVDSLNLGIDAEIKALQAEHDRLTEQLRAAGLPVVMPARRRRLLPPVPAACPTCLQLRAQLDRAIAAEARAQRKRAAMHVRYRRMLRKQDEYRIERASLIRQIATARARMLKAGVSRTGPATRRAKSPLRRAQ